MAIRTLLEIGKSLMEMVHVNSRGRTISVATLSLKHAIHSDYWRTVPLYEAPAADCVSIEADVWLEDNDPPVGHVKKVIKSTRTLRTLYIDPLINTLSNRNVSSVFETSKKAGVFETDPNAAIILMLDFKTDGHDLWPVVLS